MAPGLKALASIDDYSLSHGVGWRRFMGPRCLLDKVKNSLSVWRVRFSHHDVDWGNLGICWRYLVEATIGWDQSRHQSGICSGGKKGLTQEQVLLVIFEPRPTSVGEVW